MDIKGLGKTAVTTYMMDVLSKEVGTREEADALHIHEINCNSKTLFMVVRSLVNTLLPANASPFTKRGLGTGDAFDELYKQLDRVGGTHLIVFDEIDYLNKLIYFYTSWLEPGQISRSLLLKLGSLGSVTTTRSEITVIKSKRFSNED